MLCYLRYRTGLFSTFLQRNLEDTVEFQPGRNFDVFQYRWGKYLCSFCVHSMFILCSFCVYSVFIQSIKNVKMTIEQYMAFVGHNPEVKVLNAVMMYYITGQFLYMLPYTDNEGSVKYCTHANCTDPQCMESRKSVICAEPGCGMCVCLHCLLSENNNILYNCYGKTEKDIEDSEFVFKCVHCLKIVE